MTTPISPADVPTALRGPSDIDALIDVFNRDLAEPWDAWERVYGRCLFARADFAEAICVAFRATGWAVTVVAGAPAGASLQFRPATSATSALEL